MYNIEIELANHREEYDEIVSYHIPHNPAEHMWVRLEDKDGSVFFTPISRIESITVRVSEESKGSLGFN